MGHYHDHPHDHDHNGHDHDHGHHHSHNGHDHDHGHHGQDEQGSQLGLDAKLARLLGHWATHNHEHAHSYRNWAEQARKAGHTAIAELLDAVALQTLRIAEQLEGGLAAMSRKP